MKNEILNLDEILSYHNITDEYNYQLACMEIGASTKGLGTIAPTYTNAYSVVLVESGSATYSINYHDYQLHEGDLLVLFPQLLTAITGFSDDFHARHLICEDLLFESLIEKDSVADTAILRTIDTIPIIQLVADDRLFLSGLLRLVTSTIHYNGNNKEQMLMHLVHVCQLRLMDFHDDTAMTAHPFSHTEKLFRDFIRLVTVNFRKEHKTDFYASRLSVSKSYLSRIVRQESNHSIKDIILDLLYHESCRLLRQTDKPISEIADDLRFNDNSAFTRFFIKKNGMSPMEYRNIGK